MEFYSDLIDVSHIQKFYGLELLIIKGSSRKLARRYPPTFWGGGY